MKVILNNLKACDYDVIMLDLGNNTKDYTYTSLEESNQVLMVITMDLACLNDTNLLFGTLRSLNFTMDKIKFVANKMPKDARLDINVKDIEETFGVPILEYIPENPNMRTVNNSGNPLVLTTDNEYTKAIISLANKVVPVFPQRRPSGGGGQTPSGKGNDRQQAPKGNKGNGGFFGKLFGKK
jgi:pilus assembly protein CpaE